MTTNDNMTDEASHRAMYARRHRDYSWNSKCVYQDKARITCPGVSRWAALRSKRVLSTPICRGFMLVFTLMVLTLVVLSPGSPPTDFKIPGDGKDNVLSRKNTPPQASVRSTAIAKTRLPEGDDRIVLTTNRTMEDGFQPTTESAGPAISVFVQKYSPRYPQKHSKFLSYLGAISKQKWVYNASNAKAFRAELRAALGNKGKFEDFITTRQNTRVGKKISFYLHGSMLMSKQFYKLLPRTTVYKRGRYRSCSVVGSSGVLNGFRCGKIIDKAQFVIRFNLAYVKGYEADVGQKTNFTTLNPSLVQRRFKSLKSKQNYTDFTDVLKQFKGSHLWLPAFASTSTHRTLVRVASAAQYSKLVTPIFGHPDHYTTVANLWKATLNLKGRTTTGLHVLTSVFDLCDQIDVFGFWPFAKSLEGKKVPYHYHDARKGTSTHSFTEEFKAILHLHELGIVNLHLGSCL